MWSVRYWCQPPRKVLFLVPAAFLCLISLTMISLDCLSSQDQNFLCPIFFNKHDTTAFESFPYGIQESINTEIPTVELDSNSFVLPAVDDSNNLVAPDVDYSNSLMAPVVDDTNSFAEPSFDYNNIFNVPDVDSSLVTSFVNSSKIPQHEEIIDVSVLQRKIDELNNKQIIFNTDKFGPITNDTIIIVIQVHHRLDYLQVLLESLERAKYIEHTLLVFSHGWYSEEINFVIQTIQFARFIQTFFPYSLQTHPNKFPGFSPNDCPHGISQKEIEKTQCQGQPRNVESLQEKHNWWWKVNMVFSGLRITKAFNGIVLFLEEDHYVLPDFLHVLRLMRNTAPEKCPDCNILVLGLSPKYFIIDDYRGKSDKVYVDQWNNMGYAFDRQFWSGLNSQRCSDMFCEYNDYNWNYTLINLSQKCLSHELKPLNVVSPRIFCTRDCEVYFDSKKCTREAFLQLMDSLHRDVSEFLFPPELTVLSTDHSQGTFRQRGGWDDRRDIQLCKNISQQLHW